MLPGSRFIGSIALSIPAFCIIFVACPRIVDGRARDAALPVPSSMVLGRTLPHGAYLAAANSLREASRTDGEAQIVRAEALILANGSPQEVTPLLEVGLKGAPANVRGWLLLTMANAKENPRLATRALSLALTLAPFDYWTAAMKAKTASLLWDELTADQRQEAITETQALWDQPIMRDHLLGLLSTKQGTRLVARAFANRREDLISINRWVSKRLRQASSSP